MEHIQIKALEDIPISSCYLSDAWLFYGPSRLLRISGN